MKLSEISSEKPKSMKLSQVQTESIEKPFGEKALEFVEPTVEALGTAGGALLGGTAGTFGAGPIGTAVGGVAGGGLGYAASKEAMQKAREALGYAKPTGLPESAKRAGQELVTGATYEAGGRALPSILQGAGKLGSSIGELLTRTPETRAAKIAGEALGPNLQQARQVLKSAANDITASQALALIDPKTGRAVLDAPTAQSLLKRAEARDPEFYTKLFGQQDAARVKQLESIAGGSNQTAAKEAREQLKKELNEKLIPTLKTELEAANIAGKMKPKLGGEAERMEKAAAQKVEDVRRFTAAGERAAKGAPMQAPSFMGGTREPFPAPYRELPSQFGKYTYLGELSDKAEKVAADAAEGSLRFGDAARFARAAEQSLEAHGLRPLESKPIIQRIEAKLKDPSLAGNRDIEYSLKQVIKDLGKWTNEKGVIDAFAEDSIRKNSVNAAIQKLYPSASKESQKQLAASVIESVRPILIDAIEQAGGTGYRQYLTDYAKGSQAIGQTKLGGELLGLYQSSPQEFIRVVEGNSPDKIEKIFGPGSYSIFKEMSQGAQKTLKNVATELRRENVATEQAKAGAKRLEDVLGTNLDFFRLPHWMTSKVTLANDVIARLEGKVSQDTLKALTEAGKSAKSFDELLSLLPDQNKKEVLRNITPGITTGGVIAGTQDRRK